MTRPSRWSVVAAVLLAVVTVPLLPRLLPVDDADVSTADLLDRVRASAGVGHSGYAETRGSVLLPVGDDLGEVGELLAGTTRLRVWWQDSQAWRVDRLLPTGERDLVRAGATTTSYDYEDARARVTVDPGADPGIRLPRTTDLLPPALARTVLEGVADSAVRRLEPRRVAGIDAPGLRYTPPREGTTIDRVDVWVDPGSGLPLRVEVRAAGSSAPDVVSAFEQVEIERPDDDLVAFRPAPSIKVEPAEVLDIADAAGRYAPYLVPDRLAGLERRSGEGAAGVYGTGVSRLIAVPLRRRESGPLREQLRAAPGAVVGEQRTVAADGVLTVLLTGGDRDGDGASWLVAGTVTEPVLRAAAAELVRLDLVGRDGP